MKSHVSIGFEPKGEEDFRLLLRLAKCLRLSSREQFYSIVMHWEFMLRDAEDETEETP